MAVFYTNACLLCQKPGTFSSSSVCSGCFHDWPSIPNACPTCADTVTDTDYACGHCLTHPPVWKTLTCAGNYQGNAAWLLKRFKYQQQLAALPVLTEKLLQQVRTSKTPLPQALVPMPLHWQRQWSRGFNQSHLLAQKLGDALNIPVITKGIRRVHKTPALENLSRSERYRVVRNAFRTPPISYDHVAIVDDVLTTGASATTLARSILSQGANSVDLWVVAKTLGGPSR